MRYLIIAVFLLTGCYNADFGVGTSKETPDAATEECIPETSELGYCSRNYKYEGTWKVVQEGGWDCNCSEEELYTMEQEAIVPECCSWNDEDVEGYMNIMPLSSYTGIIQVHTSQTIFYGSYEIQADSSMYIRKGYTPEDKLHYTVDLNENSLTFSTAYPPPYFDPFSDEKAENFRLVFTIQAEKLGEVGVCVDESFGYCHRGPVCNKLLAGCVPRELCMHMVEDLSYLYGSWEKEGCEMFFFDPLMMGNYL